MAQMETLCEYNLGITPDDLSRNHGPNGDTCEYNLGITPDDLSRNHGKIVAIAGLSAEI